MAPRNTPEANPSDLIEASASTPKVGDMPRNEDEMNDFTQVEADKALSQFMDIYKNFEEGEGFTASTEEGDESKSTENEKNDESPNVKDWTDGKLFKWYNNDRIEKELWELVKRELEERDLIQK